MGPSTFTCVKRSFPHLHSKAMYDFVSNYSKYKDYYSIEGCLVSSRDFDFVMKFSGVQVGR